jgi:hypothetical protein
MRKRKTRPVASAQLAYRNAANKRLLEVLNFEDFAS